MYVAFASSASNLVANDTNGLSDVFVFNRLTRETVRASVATGGSQGNADSGALGVSISGNGQFVAFSSDATNLSPDFPTFPYEGLYLHDLTTRETTMVADTGYGDSPALSYDGSLLVFQTYYGLDGSDNNSATDIYLHKRITGETRRVSVGSNGAEANGDSGDPRISSDGRYVAFTSSASNLVAADSNSSSDIFLTDLLTEEIIRVSVASDGTQANSSSFSPGVSADGRYVVFRSRASNLVSEDTNNEDDIFLHDRVTGETTRVSVSSDGMQANWYSGSPSISGSGQFVAFTSSASNLVAADSNSRGDIFLTDLLTEEIIRVSVASDGTQANSSSFSPGVSADGRYVVFRSSASTLVSGDINNKPDVFLHDRLGSETELVSVGVSLWDVTVSHWACGYILGIWQAGLTVGHIGGQYRPDNPVTRAEQAVFLIKGIHGETYAPPVPDGSHPFTDIAGHWAEAWIEDLYDEGMTFGYLDGSYRPSNNVSRAEMAVFLLKAKHGASYTPPGPTGGSFSDVGGHWAEAWIEELAEEGITSGYPDSTFRPGSNVTRAEMAVVLVNAFGLAVP